MANIVAAIKAHCPTVASAAGNQLRPGSATTILPMKTADDLAVWEKLDDVIMVSHLLLRLLMSFETNQGPLTYCVGLCAELRSAMLT
jgi:hypothetical protein